MTSRGFWMLNLTLAPAQPTLPLLCKESLKLIHDRHRIVNKDLALKFRGLDFWYWLDRCQMVDAVCVKCLSLRGFQSVDSADPFLRIAKVYWLTITRRARCLKITEKVSLNIASEAKWSTFTFWVDKSLWKMPKIEILNLVLKQCYQIGQF